MTYEENTTRFHNIEIRSCLVHSTEDRADAERPDGRIEGIHLDILSEAFGYILQGETSTTQLSRNGESPNLDLWGGMVEFTEVGGF